MNESTFMREYYRIKYEDPVGTVDRRSETCSDANKKMQHLECKFFEELKQKCPELMKLYDELSEQRGIWLNLAFEELYFIGVRDRERSLQPQK